MWPIQLEAHVIQTMLLCAFVSSFNTIACNTVANEIAGKTLCRDQFVVL